MTTPSNSPYMTCKTAAWVGNKTLMTCVQVDCDGVHHYFVGS